MYIRACSYDEIMHLKNAAIKEHVEIVDTTNSLWWCAYDSEYIGCCCATISRNTVRFRGDFVLNVYRRNGAYKKLFNSRLGFILSFSSQKRITAYCTLSSVGIYLKNGFSIVKKKRLKDDTAIYFVERILND